MIVVRKKLNLSQECETLTTPKSYQHNFFKIDLLFNNYLLKLPWDYIICILFDFENNIKDPKVVK